MYKAKPFLDKDSLLSLYFSYIHSYINYSNLGWSSTSNFNLKKIHNQQKHVLRIVYNKDRYYHRKELFRPCNGLNVYKLNLLNTRIFFYKKLVYKKPRTRYPQITTNLRNFKNY